MCVASDDIRVRVVLHYRPYNKVVAELLAQRVMERAMLGISQRDRIRNGEIRRRTRIIEISSIEWQWVGHIPRRTNGRWIQKLSNGVCGSANEA